MTALALVALARDSGHRALVQTAAAGQLGRMIFRLAGRADVSVINVVRREEQAAILRAVGAEVLVSDAPDFQEALAARCRYRNATMGFDAVAGAMTGILVGAMPARSDVVVYGALSGERCGGIEPMELAFGAKRVRGFEIAAHLRQIGLLRAFRLASAAQRLVASGEVQTDIRRRISLEEGPTALVDYAREMSKGKIILAPGGD
jgi:NADPH:quinone reductase-like Zn-dependent oxidoreductase